MAVGGKGLSVVHQRGAELEAQRKSFGLKKRSVEFRWDGGEAATDNAMLVRILGDDVLVSTQQHRSVPLAEAGKFFYGVCRHAYPVKAEFCHVCDVLQKQSTADYKAKKKDGLIPTDIAVALAVEMELVKGRTYRPKFVEFEIPPVQDSEKGPDATDDAKAYRALLNRLGKPGTKVDIPNIGLMIGTMAGKQGLFDYAMRRPTISDRVFEISRYGTKLETVWDWNHQGPDDDMPDPAPMLKEFLAKYPFELPEEWVLRNADEGRYNFFFKLEGPTDGAEGEAPAAANPDEDDNVEPVSTNRTKLMARLSGQARRDD